MSMISTKEAAKIIGVSHETLRRWRLKGEGPPYFQPFDGAACQYDREKVIEWKKKHTHDPGERDTA